MEQVFTILLFIHVIAGSIGLITGTINIIRKKGDKPHRLIGKFFFYGMIVNAIAGFIMSIMHNNIFLLIVAVFSFYMTVTGQRFLSLKKLDKDQKPKAIDWIVTGVMIFFAIAFITYGGYLLANKKNFGIILLVFGIVSIRMVRKDVKIYRGQTPFKNYWLVVHLQRMTGAYIAALTAFIVVNAAFYSPLIAWLSPSLVFVPLILYWTKKNGIRKPNNQIA